MALSTLDRFDLNPHDLDVVEGLVKRLCGEFPEPAGEEFVQRAAELSVGLPERLVSFIERYRREGMSAAVVISGFQLTDDEIGMTPPHWRERSRSTPRPDAYLTLLASRLGDLFCWKSLQDARLLNDTVPIQGDENSQTGHGSSTEFDVHCEDGYNDLRCDFVSLMCFRNRERIATTVSLMDDVRLLPEDEKVLRQPRFILTPDSETVRNVASLGQTGRRLVPLLSGDPEAPYVRIDCREYMEVADGDEEAALAMANLLAEFRRVQQAIPLDQGDVCFIDNLRCVHGRQPFRAKYDGFDRWYRKALVTRDLRKSRALRTSASDYVIDMTKYV